MLPWKFVASSHEEKNRQQRSSLEFRGFLVIQQFFEQQIRVSGKSKFNNCIRKMKAKTCQLQLLELNQIYTRSSTSIKLQKLNFSLHSWRTQQTCFFFLCVWENNISILILEYRIQTVRNFQAFTKTKLSPSTFGG